MIGCQHRSLHQSIRLLQQQLPIAAFLLRKIIKTVQKHVAAKRGVAAEQLVGAFTRHHHLVVHVVDVATHQKFGHRQGVVDRALRMPDRALHESIELSP